MKIIRSANDIENVANSCKHILMLFNGGVDSTYVLNLLSYFNCRVTALVVDLGGDLDNGKLTEIASRYAVDLEITDGRQLFVEQAIKPAIKAGAVSANACPLSLSLSRPIVAKVAVDYANKSGCDAIIHAGNGSDNSSLQLNSSISLLGYDGWYGSPVERADFTADQKLLALSSAGLKAFRELCHRGKSNLWCRNYQLACYDNEQDYFIKESRFCWTANKGHAAANRLSLTFAEGVPTHVNQQKMGIVPLIEKVNQLVGVFGIGRFAGMEHRYQGSRILELREAPAAMVIIEAYRHLETALLSPDARQKKQSIDQTWLEEVKAGRWYGVLKQALSGFLELAAKEINGTVTICLEGGEMKLDSIALEQLEAS